MSDPTSSLRVALVTGGSSGIGLATAGALIEKGFTVIITGRREAALTDAIGKLPKGKAHAIAADVSNPDSVSRLFNEIEQRFGRLDLLFNNAGRNTPSMPIEDISFETWQSVIETNLTGSFLCAQAAIRLMKKQTPKGGRIINNGSISAHTPRPFAIAYNASKHAITGLTKSIALEGREHDIACGQIDIGNATTELSWEMQKGVIQADGSTRKEAMMDVRSAADAVCFMATLPPDANALFLTVMATKMPFVGRG